MKSKITRSILFTVILLSFFYNQTAQSQIIISLLLGDKLNSDNLEFGLEGGFNRSYMSGIDGAKGLNNYHLGFYFDFRIKNEWFLNTGVRVKSNSGATKISPYTLNDKDLDTVFVNGNVTREIGYFYVPIHIKYRFAKQFFANAGVQVGLRNSAKDYFYNTYYKDDDVSFKLDIRDYVARLDAGLSGGLGYKFKGTGMNLGVTYYYGLVDVMKDSQDPYYNVNAKNSSLYIYVDIPIGAGYKKEKQKNKGE
ncbi:MAG: PorT family protein [Bacteroidales bacterium]|nr:PorT family protein [Bacteroidales bacterium]